jgi:hypothetical protein
MEIGHNEIGDADVFDSISVPQEIALLTKHLCFPALGEVRAMKLEYNAKLHNANYGRSRSSKT